MVALKRALLRKVLVNCVDSDIHNPFHHFNSFAGNEHTVFAVLAPEPAPPGRDLGSIKLR
jgi:hypothetical protein